MTGRQRKRRERFADAKAEAERLYRDNPERSAADVYRALVDKLGVDKVPTTERPVRDWLKGFGRDESGPWSLADESIAPEELPAVLRVSRALAEEGRPRLTRDVARWVARIGAAFPDMVDADASLIFVCSARAAAGHVERVEALLAFTPWRDDGAALAEAVARGTVPFQVALDGGYEAQVAAAQLRLRKEGSDDGR